MPKVIDLSFQTIRINRKTRKAEVTTTFGESFEIPIQQYKIETLDDTNDMKIVHICLDRIEGMCDLQRQVQSGYCTYYIILNNERHRLEHVLKIYNHNQYVVLEMLCIPEVV